MKRIFTILLISSTAFSCSSGNTPKCSDDIVQSILKDICAKAANRDTSEISVSAIRTTSKNSEFHSCDCEAKINAKAKVFSFIYLKAIDEDIVYTAQFTDDGKSVSVKIK